MTSRKRLGLGLIAAGMLIWGGFLTWLGLASRKKLQPRVYAQAFPTMNSQQVEADTEALIAALRKEGIPVENEWPGRFTYGRGAGAGIPQEVIGPVLIGVALLVNSYAQGFIGQIGAEHSIAIRRVIKEWLSKRKDDEFYIAIETANGQQVRARFRNGGSFDEAYDALDQALKQLPPIPGGFGQIEWDGERHRWIHPL